MKKLVLSLAVVAAGFAAQAQISAGSMMFGGTIGFSTQSSTSEISGTNTALDGTTDGPTTNNLTIAPTFGYFLKDNLAIGVALSFTNGSTESDRVLNTSTGATRNAGGSLGPNEANYTDKTSNNAFGINLFANKYNEINDKWMWFYGATLGFSTGSGTTTVIRSNGALPPTFSAVELDGATTTNINLGANLGVLHFLNENWALQAGLSNLLGVGYTMTSQESDLNPGTLTNKSNNFNVNLGPGSFTLGTLNVGVFYFLR